MQAEVPKDLKDESPHGAQPHENTDPVKPCDLPSFGTLHKYI